MNTTETENTAETISKTKEPIGQTKKCKYCKSEIDKKAKVCPICRKKQKKHHFFGIAIILIIIIAIAGVIVSNDDEPKDANTGEVKDFFKKGEVVELNNIKTTFIDVFEYDTANLFKPDDGNVYVLCEFLIENNSEDEITVSSLMSFDAYFDGFATNQSISALAADETKSQLDATIASGKKLQGIIGYEVKKDWKEIEIRFSPSYWGKDIIFKYNR
ncbi:MAG: DUF5067 domain-containing protein [Lachnospiraceae bacterium]|nr:DUF5067 domain-containing protein [Lachnospiraceae bacterium]